MGFTLGDTQLAGAQVQIADLVLPEPPPPHLRGARLVHEGRFSRERRRLLHRLGHLLVELGERLGQRTYRQTLEVAGSVSSEPCREPCL